MKLRRILVQVVVVMVIPLVANAAVRNPLRIKVLDSESRSVTVNGSDIPKNCDFANYDAYCHSSKTEEVTNTLLVQEDDKPPYRVSCNIETKWSRCVPLVPGLSYDAKKEKHGLVVYYLDERGKLRQQRYNYVDGDSSHADADKDNAASGSSSTDDGQSEGVKCNFTSTPLGAEVTVDGKYVGSTPSVISLGAGDHDVEMSLAGFGLWKRDLTILTGSQISVNAVLEKRQ
jgi:hypothetical protein